MEVVGLTPKMDRASLLVWILMAVNVSVLQGLKVMVSRVVKMLMNAKKRKPVSALNAAAKTHGVVTSRDLLYIRDHDTCISKRATEVKSAWAAVWVILIGLAMAGTGAYLVYKYRIRSYMDSEIRAIMAQYMPLDSQTEVPNHVSEDHA